MKYIVIEMQKNADGTLTHLESIHNTLAEAESKYHAILSYAAISEISIHSAIILSEDGNPVMYKHFNH